MSSRDDSPTRSRQHQQSPSNEDPEKGMGIQNPVTTTEAEAAAAAAAAVMSTNQSANSGLKESQAPPQSYDIVDGGEGGGGISEEAKDEEEEDLGWKPWIQVSAAWALYWNSLGLLNGYGAFQNYYEATLLSSSSPSSISWIGSVQVFFLMAGGTVFGPLYDMGHARSLVICGTILVTLGLFTTAQATQFYQILLSQGFCIGIGTGFLYIPAITLVPGYFKPGRRALAMGVAATGSGLGALVYPLLFERLTGEGGIGFQWTVRVMGFVTLGMCCFAAVVLEPRLKKKNGKLGGGDGGGGGALKLLTSPRETARLAGLFDKLYMTQCSAIFFSNVAWFVPYYYIQGFAATHGLGTTEGGGGGGDEKNLAKYLLVIMNASSIPGRVIPSIVADRCGVIETYIGICGLTAITLFYWISVVNSAGNVAFAVLYGFFSGSVVTLAPVVLASFTDLSILGTRLGFVAFLKGIASLIGPPIAGALLGNTGSYLGMQLFAGLCISLTVALSTVLRIMIARADKKKNKA